MHEDLEASIMEITKSLDNHNWFLDFGALEHITSDNDKLDLKKENSFGRRVRAVGNEPHVVHARGPATLLTKEGEIKLSNILYIPSITKNLLSIGALTDESKVVVFTKTHCLVWDNIAGRNVLAIETRQRSNGLYKLTMEIMANFVATDDLSQPWHQCYRHLHYCGLMHLSTQARIKDMPKLQNFHEVCEVCQVGRQSC